MKIGIVGGGITPTIVHEIIVQERGIVIENVNQTIIEQPILIRRVPLMNTPIIKKHYTEQPWKKKHKQK